MISGITYLIAGLLVMANLPGIIALPIGIVLLFGFLFFARSHKINIG